MLTLRLRWLPSGRSSAHAGEWAKAALLGALVRRIQVERLQLGNREDRAIIAEVHSRRPCGDSAPGWESLPKAWFG
jgi:hypothetical protein